MNYLLGIDLGTSSVKIGLFESQSLRLVTQTSQEYPIVHPQPHFVEQDPDAWWRAVQTAVSQAIRQIDPNDLLAIGLDGQMHGLVCLDNKHKPLGNAIIWADGRSTQEQLDLQAAQSDFTAILPGLPATGFAASTALWLNRHQPERLKQTAVCLQPKDYIRYKLTGTIATDPSDAAASWLYDIRKDEWAEEVVTFCGLRRDQMPPVRPSTAVAGTLLPETAVQLGLPANIPVVTGAADLAAQALGHAIMHPKQLLVTVGSGGQVVLPMTTPEIDAEQRTYTFNHCLPNLWYKQAAILSAGLSLRWLRNVLNKHHFDYPQLSTMADRISKGANGLIFLPYLSGERTPHLNPDASGLFFGLRDFHTTGHLARAVMEGVAFALKDCLRLIAPEDSSPVVLSGGGVQSKVWCQIMADVWQRPLNITNPETPRACLGSAILAGMGVGLWQSAADVTPLLAQNETTVEPKPSPVYQAAYEKYGRLYQLLKQEMGQM